MKYLLLTSPSSHWPRCLLLSPGNPVPETALGVIAILLLIPGSSNHSGTGGGMRFCFYFVAVETGCSTLLYWQSSTPLLDPAINKGQPQSTMSSSIHPSPSSPLPSSTSTTPSSLTVSPPRLPLFYNTTTPYLLLPSFTPTFTPLRQSFPTLYVRFAILSATKYLNNPLIPIAVFHPLSSQSCGTMPFFSPFCGC